MPDTKLKSAAIRFLQQVVAGDVKGAYDRYVDEGLRHHNPYFPGDAASLRSGMEEDEQRCPGKQLIVVNSLEDGDRVAVHSRLIRPGSGSDIAVVHLFRFSQGKIVEMWDVAMTAPDRVANQFGMF